MKNYLDLTGRVALVTGASSGIGAATAAVLADLGASVAVGCFHNVGGAQDVVHQLANSGKQRHIAIRADVSKAANIPPMIADVERDLGPIDILVNNAGSLVKRQAIRELTEELWDEVLDLNLKSAAFCSRAVASGMIERKRGSIVNVVSIAGRNGGGPGAGPYSTAKGGLIAFTKALAKELAPHGVRVNALSPGVIATPFHEVFSTPEMIANFVKSIPLGRTGTSMECATAIAFLVSDAAAYIVGETLEVNGGQLML